MLTYINVVACLVIVVRLLSYQRGNSKFKRSMSIAAWLISVCMVAQAVLVFFEVEAATLHGTLLSVLLMLATLRSRGNVSCLFRGDHV